MAPTVVLLRTPETEKEDKYERVLKQAGCRAFSVPVLHTALTNINALANLRPEDYAAVIFTSVRASEAWKSAITDASELVEHSQLFRCAC